MEAAYRAKEIAQRYLPQRAHYWYSRCKLATDPLYVGVGAALRDASAPLLDLGCGIGLLAHTLRDQGFVAAYRGIDNDAAKIASAREAAERASLREVHFETLDLANNRFPQHRGSVALLDVLQFMPAEAAQALIENAIACIAGDARLVIRTGLERSGARMRFTRAVDTGSRKIGWMNAAPHWYPTRTSLEILFARYGLYAKFVPLTGLLPFDNWLVVARRE